MDFHHFEWDENEKPLEKSVENGGFCGIFRKIACIGDSLSSGEFESFENETRGWHDMYDYSWGQYLARDAGCTVYNFSKGGMTARAYDVFAREKGFYGDAYRAQAYILALGVNDISEVLRGEQKFGDISDVDFTDYAKNKATFAGYYATLLAKYHVIQPKAKFFLMTMPHAEGVAKDREELEDRHQELLYQLAEHFPGCYVLDFRRYAPVYDANFKRNFYMGGHLNAAGYRLTALMVESYIDYYIRHNPENFTQVGFIGTAHHNANYPW